MSGSKVELDREALFALASDTRLDLLKSLQGDRRTLSQLAEKLGIDKAALHRHLRKLEEGGLVKKEDDHGFIYYSLTWKAKNLVSPSDKTRVVMLLSSAIALVAVIAIIAYTMTMGFGSESSSPTGLLDTPDVTGTYSHNATIDISSLNPPTSLSDISVRIGDTVVTNVSTNEIWVSPYSITFVDMDGDMMASNGDHFLITGITSDVTFYLIYVPTGEIIATVEINV